MLWLLRLSAALCVRKRLPAINLSSCDRFFCPPKVYRILPSHPYIHRERGFVSLYFTRTTPLVDDCSTLLHGLVGGNTRATHSAANAAKRQLSLHWKSQPRLARRKLALIGKMTCLARETKLMKTHRHGRWQSTLRSCRQGDSSPLYRPPQRSWALIMADANCERIKLISSTSSRGLPSKSYVHDLEVRTTRKCVDSVPSCWRHELLNAVFQWSNILHVCKACRRTNRLHALFSLTVIACDWKLSQKILQTVERCWDCEARLIRERKRLSLMK